MPTTRTRRTRPTSLSVEAVEWLTSEDAGRFFENPKDYPPYAGEISKLPGVLPWWNPLSWIWRKHTEGVEIPHAPGEAAALSFVKALHEQYRRSRS